MIQPIFSRKEDYTALKVLYWCNRIFGDPCVAYHKTVAPIWGGSHPSPCLPNPRRSLIPSILLPWLNLSWYPLHLQWLQPAGVEWESRCWGDKSPQPTKLRDKISPGILFLCLEPVSNNNSLYNAFTFIPFYSGAPKRIFESIRAQQTGRHSRNVRRL